MSDQDGIGVRYQQPQNAERNGQPVYGEPESDPTLQSVLAADPRTGGHDIVVETNDQITGDDGGPVSIIAKANQQVIIRPTLNMILALLKEFDSSNLVTGADEGGFFMSDGNDGLVAGGLYFKGPNDAAPVRIDVSSSGGGANYMRAKMSALQVNPPVGATIAFDTVAKAAGITLNGSSRFTLPANQTFSCSADFRIQNALATGDFISIQWYDVTNGALIPNDRLASLRPANAVGLSSINFAHAVIEVGVAPIEVELRVTSRFDATGDINVGWAEIDQLIDP